MTKRVTKVPHALGDRDPFVEPKDGADQVEKGAYHVETNENIMAQSQVGIFEYNVHATRTQDSFIDDEDTMVNYDIHADKESVKVEHEKLCVDPHHFSHSSAVVKTSLELPKEPRILFMDTLEDAAIIITGVAILCVGACGSCCVSYILCTLLFMLSVFLLPSKSSIPFSPLRHAMETSTHFKIFRIHIPLSDWPCIEQANRKLPLKTTSMGMILCILCVSIQWRPSGNHFDDLCPGSLCHQPKLLNRQPTKTIHQEQSMKAISSTLRSIETLRSTEHLPKDSIIMPIDAHADGLDPLLLVGPPSEWPFIPGISQQDSSLPVPIARAAHCRLPQAQLIGSKYVEYVRGIEWNDPGAVVVGFDPSFCQFIRHVDDKMMNGHTGIYTVNYWFRCVSRRNVTEFDVETPHVSRYVQVLRAPIPRVKSVDPYQHSITVEFTGFPVSKPHYDMNHTLTTDSFFLESEDAIKYQAKVTRVEILTADAAVRYRLWLDIRLLSSTMAMNEPLHFTIVTRPHACYHPFEPYETCLDFAPKHNRVTLYQKVDWEAQVKHIERIGQKDEVGAVIVTVKYVFNARMGTRQGNNSFPLNLDDFYIGFKSMNRAVKTQETSVWWKRIKVDDTRVDDESVLRLLSLGHEYNASVLSEVYIVLAELSPAVNLKSGDVLILGLNQVENITAIDGYAAVLKQDIFTFELGCCCDVNGNQVTTDAIDSCPSNQVFAADCQCRLIASKTKNQSTRPMITKTEVPTSASSPVAIITTADVPTSVVSQAWEVTYDPPLTTVDRPRLVAPLLASTEHVVLIQGHSFLDYELVFDRHDWKLTKVESNNAGILVELLESIPKVTALSEGLFNVVYTFTSCHDDKVVLTRWIRAIPKCPTIRLKSLGPGYRTITIQFSSPPSAVNASLSPAIPLGKESFIAIAKSKDGSLSKGIPRIRKVEAVPCTMNVARSATRISSGWFPSLRWEKVQKDEESSLQMPDEYILHLDWSGFWSEGDELMIGTTEKDHRKGVYSSSYYAHSKTTNGCFDSRPPYEKCSSKVIQIALDIAPRLEFGDVVEFYGQHGLRSGPFSVTSTHGWFSGEAVRYIWRKWILALLGLTRYENELIVRVSFTKNVTSDRAFDGPGSSELLPKHFEAVVFRQKDEDLGKDLLIKRKLSWFGKLTLLDRLLWHKITPASWGYEHPYYFKKKSSLVMGPGSWKVVRMDQDECSVPLDGTRLNVVRVRRVATPVAARISLKKAKELEIKKRQVQAYQKISEMGLLTLAKLFIKSLLKSAWLSSLHWVLDEHMTLKPEQDSKYESVQEGASMPKYDLHLSLPLDQGSFSMGDLILVNLAGTAMWGVDGSKLPVRCHPLNLDLQHQFEATRRKREQEHQRQQQQKQELEWLERISLKDIPSSWLLKSASAVGFLFLLTLVGTILFGYIFHPGFTAPPFVRLWLLVLCLFIWNIGFYIESLCRLFMAFVYHIVSDQVGI